MHVRACPPSSQPLFQEVAWHVDAPPPDAAGPGKPSRPAGAAASTGENARKRRRGEEDGDGAGGIGAGGPAGGGPAGAAGRGGQEDLGFEEVAAEDSDRSSDSDSASSEDEDEEGGAEVAALGAMLLRKKIRKEELIDACYHRCRRRRHSRNSRYSHGARKGAAPWLQPIQPRRYRLYAKRPSTPLFPLSLSLPPSLHPANQ